MEEWNQSSNNICSTLMTVRDLRSTKANFLGSNGLTMLIIDVKLIPYYRSLAGVRKKGKMVLNMDKRGSV
jgi:hypothetical protein